MTQEEFVTSYWVHQDLISEIAQNAFSIHESENHKYGLFPYSVHLHKTLEKVIKYGYELCETDDDILILCISALFHDILEDTRTSYHELEQILYDHSLSSYKVHHIQDIVWAITEPIGRNRKERQCPEYFEKIRQCEFASFIKMCDRLANIEMSKYYSRQKFKMYKKEEFLKSINLNEIPKEMLKEYKSYE